MDKLGMSSFVKGELTVFVEFDTTRVTLKNGSIPVGNLDMKGLDNSWNNTEGSELDNEQNRWWFLDRSSNKPILIDGDRVKDISLYHSEIILCTITNDGICAYAVGPQINN